jgi:hypothetical protein
VRNCALDRRDGLPDRRNCNRQVGHRHAPLCE